MTYDPSVGRWLQQDPAEFDAGDPDLYRYVGNDPVNATDPSGLTDEPAGKGPPSAKSMLDPFLGPIEIDFTVNISAGKEIGPNLRKGLAQLDAQYKKLTKDQKIKLLDRLTDPIDGLTAWDIRSLSSENSQKFGLVGPNDMADTVTVDGRVYLAPAVNYILYGHINRLLHDDPEVAEFQLLKFNSTKFSNVVSTVKDYRSIKNMKDGFGVDPFVVWAKIGYTGDWSYARNLNASYTKKGYNITPSKTPYKGIMPWVLGASIVDGDFAEGTSGIINFDQGNEPPPNSMNGKR